MHDRSTSAQRASAHVTLERKLNSSTNKPNQRSYVHDCENPFDSPFDDPSEEDDGEDDSEDDSNDEEFGKFGFADPTTNRVSYPQKKNPFKNTVYAVEDNDDMTEALLPGKELPDLRTLEGKGLIQPVQARFDLVTRSVRHAGSHALLKLNLAKELAERKVEEAFFQSLSNLSWDEQRKAYQEVEDSRWNKARGEKLRQEENGFRRIQKGAVEGVIRPVRLARSYR